MSAIELQLPKGWAPASLEDVARWGSGGTPSRKFTHFYDGSIPWIKTGELGQKYVRTAEEHITEEAIAKSSAKVFPAGSVGIAMYGATIGKLSIWGIDASTNQACAVAQPYSDIISTDFLYYYLLSEKSGLIEAGKGGAQPNISQGILKEWPIRLPPINEQHRIVAKVEELFSELDKGVESLKTAREQLKAYRHALLKHAFEGKLTAQWRQESADQLETADQLLERIREERGARYQEQMAEWKQAVKDWEAAGKPGKKPRRPARLKQLEPVSSEEAALLPNVPEAWRLVRLSEVAEVGTGMSVSAARTVSDPVDVPYLRVANVQRGFLDLSEMKSMTVERCQLLNLLLRRWDVLFTEGGDRDKLGRGWIWESQIEPCITQNHVFRASPYLPSESNAKLLSHWGNTIGQRYFVATGKQTTNLASINKTVLSAFPVPLIPVAEQRELCDRIDQVVTVLDAQEDEIINGLNRANVLRQSILQRAFSGKLVLQDPNDEPASVLLERIKAEKEQATKNKKKRKDEAA